MPTTAADRKFQHKIDTFRAAYGGARIFANKGFGPSDGKPTEGHVPTIIPETGDRVFIADQDGDRRTGS